MSQTPRQGQRVRDIVPGLTVVGIGARRLGYKLTILPPGKAQCPFHSHRGEEEMFLILEGTDELRFGNQRYPPPAGVQAKWRSHIRL